ncbi:MAG: sigma-54 interaction domain-containing protein, partial [Candidatus Rokuibacteriota bacterium]
MDPLAQLLGESPGIAAVREQVRKLLARQAESRRTPPILIQGETGTGKGLLARALHGASARATGPFVDVNCAAIPETLLEAEMFGVERGAFTDARQAKPGLLQLAHRGTIFLDEIGLLPEGLQAKLLKAIEERAVRRLGGTRSEPVDVSVIAATNEDLAASVSGRRFRADLYHRLAVVMLSLPPLRDRGGDVLLLAEHFLARACDDYGMPPKILTPAAREALIAYRWPGNIRELSNVLERVALLSDTPAVTPQTLALPAEVVPARPPAAPAEAPRTLDDAVDGVEREHLLAALEATAWNVTRAAMRLGVSRNTLRYRIEKHALRPGAPPPRRRLAVRPSREEGRPAAPEP